MKNRLVFAAIFGLATLCNGQTNSTAATATTPPQRATDAEPVTFHSDMLDLSFTYPGSLIAEKLPSLDEQHATLSRKYGPDEKPEDLKSDQCTDKALIARRNDEPSTPGENTTTYVTIYGDKRGTVMDVEHSITAKILIARVGVECMPAEAQNRLDDVAAAMAAQLAQGEDLKPIDQPIWYEAGKMRIHFAAAQSASDEKKPDAKSNEKKEHLWVASAAFVSNGNLVSIFFRSNDLPFLNEMLHGNLTLGKQKAAPLFPAEIGSGTPIQPKP
jgi:hypothetical protein